MKVIISNCPACGASYDGPIRGGILTCEYCGAKFALESDELEALGYDGSHREEESEEEWVDADIQPFDEFAREACEEFINSLESFNADEFNYADNIRNGLDIKDDEEIYLIHDDTLFKSGKNGFAITNYGLNCREMGEGSAHYLGWGDFAERSKPQIKDSLIMSDDISIAYYTGSSDVRDKICSLLRDLRKHAKQFDWE